MAYALPSVARRPTRRGYAVLFGFARLKSDLISPLQRRLPRARVIGPVLAEKDKHVDTRKPKELPSRSYGAGRNDTVSAALLGEVKSAIGHTDEILRSIS